MNWIQLLARTNPDGAERLVGKRMDVIRNRDKEATAGLMRLWIKIKFILMKLTKNQMQMAEPGNWYQKSIKWIAQRRKEGRENAQLNLKSKEMQKKFHIETKVKGNWVAIANGKRLKERKKGRQKGRERKTFGGEARRRKRIKMMMIKDKTTTTVVVMVWWWSTVWFRRIVCVCVEGWSHSSGWSGSKERRRRRRPSEKQKDQKKK